MKRVRASLGNCDTCAKTVANPASKIPERWNSHAKAPAVQPLSHSTMPNPAADSRFSGKSPNLRAQAPDNPFNPASSPIVAR